MLIRPPSAARREIESVGYVVLPKALDADSVERLRNVLERLLQEDDETWGAERLVEIRERGALRNLANADEAFLPLLEDSPALELVDLILGARAVLNCYDALTLFPGAGRYPWDFHTDLMPLVGLGFPLDMVPGVNVLYYFDDLTEANGATWVVPSSHLWVAPPDHATLVREARPLEVQTGDIVVFDARLWHCAGTNSADVPRTIIKTLFTLPWYRPQMDFTRAVDSSILGRLSDRAQRYLGMGNVPPVSVEELRSQLAGDLTGSESGADDASVDGGEPR